MLRTGLLLLLVVVVLAGCGGGSQPRMRFGCYPTTTVGTNFPNPEDLGRHGYRSGGSEKNGIVYTCRAGHIDLAHLRIAADWTKYLTKRSFESLMAGDAEFSFKAKPAPSRYYVQIEYPKGWEELPRQWKEEIARNVSVEMGQYFGWVATTWHEIVTWYGYKFTGLLPEFTSAFSWEDSYSNLLGTRIAAAAMADDEHEFDEAMTIAIDRELAALGAQPRRVGIEACEKVRGDWFSGHVVYMVNMKKRNFDIGLDDGYVEPTLVPGMSRCDAAQAQLYPAPTLAAVNEHGFSVKLEIKPKIWEKGKILRAAYAGRKRRGKRVEPAAHFAQIMDDIREKAASKYGMGVGAQVSKKTDLGSAGEIAAIQR